MIKAQFLPILIAIIFSNYSAKAQDQNIQFNDTLTEKFFKIKKEYDKREYETTFYTIQIFYGSLKKADSILNDFKLSFQEINSELLFETPNYKVRIGEFKDINIASKKLEEIRRIYPGSFIIKLSKL